MPSDFTIVPHATAAEFLARAEAWLLAAEAEHNLILGIAGRLREGVSPYGEPVSLLTVEAAGRVEGCAWCTPPFSLGLTRMPPAALPALIARVAEIYAELPGVLGPPALAAAAAALWIEGQPLGLRPQMAMTIYALAGLSPPVAPPPGRARLAGEAERALLEDWTQAMHTETFGDPARPLPPGIVERLLAAGALLVWEDGEPVSMAAATAPTTHGIRINHVYTPPARRRQGYASACVGALCARQLAAGRRFCYLYADAANPTSNGIYRRLGFAPVAEALQIEFTPKEP
ncbi:GNAT family N-acetyltransferase [bacterium]|nr:GNAT family N-acetyltransferase [bacterium]